MSEPPKTKEVPCPECESVTAAVIPADSVIVQNEEDADGKVWTTCPTCDDQFLVHYRTSS